MNSGEMSIQSIHQQQKEIPVTTYEAVMNQEFVQIYKNALKYSKLELEKELHFRNVRIYENEHVHQIYTISDNKKLPHIVMLHGYGGTSLTFIRTFEHLKDHFQVHALDTFGVGLSSRGTFKEDMTGQQAASYYVQSIQQWRKAVHIDQFVLVGHSFGGYIAALYLDKYPSVVKRMIFISPVGSTEISQQEYNEKVEQAPFKSRVFYCIAEKVYNLNFRPSSIMNTCLIGKRFMNRILEQRLKLGEEQKEAWKEYLNKVVQIQDGSETGFYKLFRWPLVPQRTIQKILQQGNFKIKIEFYFGSEDWMESKGARRLAKQFQNVSFTIISEAGHQVIFDNPVQISAKIVAPEIQNHRDH